VCSYNYSQRRTGGRSVAKLLLRYFNDRFVMYAHGLIHIEYSEAMGRPRRRWEVNIKRDLQEVGGGCGDWMERAHDRDRWWALVSTVMNFRVP
jgi:hypothetical protein